MKRLISTFAVLASLSVLPSQAAAGTIDCVASSVTLSALIASEGCQVGDKLFSNFLEQTTASYPSPSDISVRGITVDENYGLVFQGGFFAGANQTLDVLLSYMVTVLDPSRLLTDIHLSFNGAVTGTGFAGVTETVMSGTTTLGQAAVNTTNPPGSLSNTIFLSQPVSSAVVRKDIFLTGGSNGTAMISFVDQVTSQTPVPEPASLTMLGTGLLGFVRYARRRGQGRAA